ncbi:hypothetical protein [Streptomyces sp. L2]|uniref:hypothetical protein n=1 Tax=Streptomyces sp. L2 TaxID=2162665 RepID=UPI0013E913B6|nr:hypothetical protein [Streptomyces sp. L2]
MVADDWGSVEETAYLFRSPANAARLLAAAERVREGSELITRSMEELSALATEGEDG